MKVEVIDAKTYVVGEKVFEVGAAIELPSELQAKLVRIHDLDTELRSLRQEAVTLAHLAQHNYAPELSLCSHKLNGQSIEFAYLTSSFANELHRHFGGLLPFTFNEDKTKVVVRERTRISDVDFEEVNYTVASVKRMLGMNRLEDQRLFAVRMAGEAKNVRINIKNNEAYQFQPIEANVIWQADDLAGFAKALVLATNDLLATKRNPADTLVLAHPVVATFGTSITRILQDGTKMRMDGIQRYAKEKNTSMVGVVVRKDGHTLVAATDAAEHGLTYRIAEPTSPDKLPAPKELFETGGNEAQWKSLLAASNVASKQS